MSNRKSQCLSPRVIKSDTILIPRQQTYAKPEFDLEYEHIIPSVQFTNAFEAQKAKNYQSWANFKLIASQLKDQVEAIAEKGKSPLGKS